MPRKPGSIILVKAVRDAEARVWFVEYCDVPGLNIEADTLEEFVDKLPGAILDLLDEGGRDEGSDGEFDVPIELIAHASTRLHRTAV